MTRRVRCAAAVLAAAVLSVVLVACVPEPEPSPSPTGFASEEEAFAAAEATYRAYVDAGNARREDPDSLPDPTVFLTGAALTAELASEQKFDDAGVSLKGDLTVHSIQEVSATQSNVELDTCIDASLTRVIEVETGADVTPAERDDIFGMTIQIVWSPTGPLISSTTPNDDQC
ncbi:MAG: hypothetical protein QM622_01760 [Microbacterium sp.]